MGEDAEGEVGGEEEGYGGDAGDGEVVEGEGAWAGVEKVAEMIVVSWERYGWDCWEFVLFVRSSEIVVH